MGLLTNRPLGGSGGSVPSGGAAISIDFVGATLPHEIVSDPVGSASQPITLDYPGDFPYDLQGLPFNTLVNVLVTAIDGVDESTALDEDFWTQPENAPTLTLGTPTENSIPVTISGEGPNSEETGSGYLVEISDDDGATWDFQSPKFIAWDTDPLEATFTGLAGVTDYWFRARSINEQPNTINDPSYSPYCATQTAETARNKHTQRRASRWRGFHSKKAKRHGTT
jgi:hypothetical protein